MTWSIVAHDPKTGAFAVAVATKAFAVGASCPFVRAGVGAVSTQSIRTGIWGPAILDGMARGLHPSAAIEGALAGDSGRGIRQVHAVDRQGRTAAWTGENCVDWCGSVAGEGISVAGNMLAGEPTIRQTLRTWNTSDDLRTAGPPDGGDGGGRGSRRRPPRKQSAAMVMVTTEDFPDLNLRVDDHVEPLRELAAGWTSGTWRGSRVWDPRRRRRTRRVSPISMRSRRAGLRVDSDLRFRR